MATPHDLAISVDADGDENGTADFVFRVAGDPVSLLPTTSCPLPLDYLQSPPAGPLAVSNMHGAVFLAHPGGFMAVTIGAFLGDSEEARCARTSCVQDCCFADLPFPGVSFLSVSTNESVIAACADSEIRFFELTALLTDKDVQPSSSITLQQSGAIQELKWLSHASRDYVLLLDDGLLSVGCVGNSPVAFMKNVDAVDSCKSGSYIAAARGKSLMIISSDLKKECCITLFSQMWSSESDPEAVRIKVDFIGWVRDDSIIVGCTQLNEAGDSEGYLVQVIRSDTDAFFESSSKSVLLILVDCYRAVMDDILPSGFGCGLLLGYLNHWTDKTPAKMDGARKEFVDLYWPLFIGKCIIYYKILFVTEVKHYKI